jgi:hypothetical protein
MRIWFFLGLVACTTNNPGTSGDDDDASCAQIVGTWDITGTCGNDSCTIAQSGCSITQLSCASGSHSTSGSIDGDSFSYRGVGPTGLPSTCQGTHNGDTISGTCTVDNAGACTFSGRRN